MVCWCPAQVRSLPGPSGCCKMPLLKVPGRRAGRQHRRPAVHGWCCTQHEKLQPGAAFAWHTCLNNFSKYSYTACEIAHRHVARLVDNRAAYHVCRPSRFSEHKNASKQNGAQHVVHGRLNTNVWPPQNLMTILTRVVDHMHIFAQKTYCPSLQCFHSRQMATPGTQCKMTSPVELHEHDGTLPDNIAPCHHPT